MKRRLLLLLTGLLIAAALVLLIATLPSRSAYRYQNKTVRQWLQQVFTTNRQSALTAFQNMGTNATPDLFRELKRADPWWNRLYTRAYPDFPTLLKRRCPRPVPQRMISFSASSVLCEYVRRAGSRRVFDDLVNVLGDKKCEARFSVFASLVTGVGPWYKDSVPTLTALSHDPDPDTRAMAAFLLWKIDGQAAPAVAALHDLMNSPGPSEMKDFAPNYLFQINPIDKAIVPALIANLQSTNFGAQIYATFTLQRCMPPATSAVPALTNLMNSSNRYLRSSVLEALQAIDPDTAAKYQSQPQSPPATSK